MAANVFVRMYEHLLPADRGSRYEDPLDAFLQKHTLGKLTGAGTQAGDRAPIVFVQLEVELDSTRDVDLIASKLEECGAPVGSELYVVAPDGASSEMKMFGSTECVAMFIDGQTLPMEIYKTNDVNQVIANLQRVLQTNKLGSLRSYWEGSEETALFFFGANADAMANAMWPVLRKEPLCKNGRLVKRYGKHPSGSAEARLPR
jgi:hypothetical protein